MISKLDWIELNWISKPGMYVIDYRERERERQRETESLRETDRQTKREEWKETLTKHKKKRIDNNGIFFFWTRHERNK